MPPKFSIIIGAYNQLEKYTKPCLESIREHTDFCDLEVIVVANGCTDGTAEYVRSLGEPFRCLEFNDPLGYAKANNIGVRESEGDYVILLNNDTKILGPEWLTLLRNGVDSGAGIVGPKILHDENTNHPFVIFFCAMFKRSLFDELDGLDERFPVGGGEDIDFCVKAQKNGHRILEVTGVDPTVKYGFPIYHAAEGTVEAFYPNWEEIFHGNMRRLKAKWENQ